MRYVKQTVSALSVALISIASAYVMDVDEVMGEEVYNVQLKVETVEVDINEIPENREVRVGVSIDNNPGFLVLYYLLEIDNRLKYHSFDRIETDLSQFCAGFSEAFSNEKIWRISNIFVKSDNIYYDNDEILIIKFFLPDEVKIGDYYEIKLLSEYHNGDDNWTSGFARENVIGEDCGPENFAPFINGGIRIVGQEPEPVQEPPQESEPPVQPSEDIAPPQPAGDNQQNNNVQQQFIAETAAPVTEATTTETTTATTSTTTVTTVPETTVSTTVSTTETEKTTTDETTVLETTVTEVSENSTDDEEGKRNIIPIMVAGITVIASVITGLIFRRKKENKDEKK